MSWSATSTWFFSSSRDGDSTTALGSLVQHLTTLSVKKFFLIHSQGYGHNWGCARCKGLMSCSLAELGHPTPTAKQHPPSQAPPKESTAQLSGAKRVPTASGHSSADDQRLDGGEGHIFTLPQPGQWPLLKAWCPRGHFCQPCIPAEPVAPRDMWHPHSPSPGTGHPPPPVPPSTHQLRLLLGSQIFLTSHISNTAGALLPTLHPKYLI